MVIIDGGLWGLHRLVDDVSHCAPDVEGVVGGDGDFGKERVGGDEVAGVAVLLEPLEGVLAVEFADGYLVGLGGAVGGVNDDDVAGVDVGVDHRVANDVDHVRCLGVRTYEGEEVGEFATVVALDIKGESRRYADVELRDGERTDIGGWHTFTHRREVGQMRVDVFLQTLAYEL